MRRNYVKTGIAAIALAALCVAGIQARYQRIPAMSSDTEKPRVSKQVSPKKLHARKFAYKNPYTQLSPVVEGMMPTPKINDKPRKMMSRKPSNLRGELHAIVNRHSDMMMYSQAYIGELNQNTGVLTPTYYGVEYVPQVGDDYLFGTATYKDGVVIIPGSIEEIDYLNVVWNRIDLATGEVYTPISFGSDYSADGYSLVYDPSTDMYFSLTYDNGTGSNLSRIDPNNGYKVEYMKWIGSDGYISTICYNPEDQQVYAFSDRLEAFTINKQNGNLSKVADISSYYDLFTEGETVRMVYSPRDRSFVMVYNDNDLQAPRLLYLDTDSWEVEEGAVVTAPSSPYISGLICPDLYAPADAPELPAVPEFDFGKGNPSGKITVTAPKVNYLGVALPDQNLSCVMTVDGNAVISENLKPGQSKTINVTCEQGLHSYTLSFAVDKDNVSPVRVGEFFVGHDAPKAPEEINLKDGVLTWLDPIESEHGGYVDFSVMTYDVYVDGEKQNGRPIQDTKYELYMPAKQKYAKISVIATANQVSSKEGVLYDVVGKAFSLPVAFDPTEEEATLFKTYDGNHDGNTFSRLEDVNNYGMYMYIGYSSSDDWFFLPLINFDDPNVMYNLRFILSGIWTKTTYEWFDICIGKQPNPQSMKAVITSEDEFELSSAACPMNLNFAVTEPGDYYIGFHLRSPQENAKGVLASDFEVSKLTTQSSAVPAEAENVSVTAGERGALKATVSAKLPTKDMVGKDLTSNVTMKVTCGNNTASVTGAPGATVSVGIDVEENGMNKFTVGVSNSKGEGQSRNYRAFVGIDKPLPPTNIKLTPSEDNMTMTLTWDRPMSKGANGGYVDVENLTYNVYYRYGVSYTKIGETKDTKFVYEVYSKELAEYIVGPSAVNSLGEESQYSMFVSDMLGTPYEIPAKEEFNSAGFNMSPYKFNMDGEYGSSFWENTTNGTGLGIGNANLIEGGIVAYSTSGLPCPAELYLPKVSTENITKVSFKLRYWDYADAPNMELWGRCGTQLDPVKIGDIKPEKKMRGEWAEAVVELPAAFCDKGWVQLRLHANLTGAASEYLLIDSYEVTADIDHDLKLESISGKTYYQLGEYTDISVSVVNAGYERMNGVLRTEFLDTKGNVLATKETTIPRITHSQRVSNKVGINLDGVFQDVEKLIVRSTITGVGDENPNNNSREIEVEVKNHQVGAINTLKATQDAATHDVTLTWEQPTLEYGDYFDCEDPSVKAFSGEITSIGNWKVYDKDGGNPFGISGLNFWTNFDEPASWIVFDSRQAGTMEDERLSPHSGSRMIMARSNQYDEELLNYNQACDMLISPEVVGGTEVTFWINHLDVSCTEYLEVWTSTTDDNPDSFKYDRNDRKNYPRFSKSGSETWEKVSFTLADNVKYFALVYRSYNEFAMMLDDITIVPARLSTYELDHYKLWRAKSGENEISLFADNLKTTGYTDAAMNSEGAIYYVTMVVKDPVTGALKEGPRSNYAEIGVSGIENITVLNGVYGGKGVITAEGHAGDTLAIYGSDGKFVKLANITSESEGVSIEAGVYIVKCGMSAAKVLVK